MAITVVGSGIATADGTEQILYTTVSSGHYSGSIALTNMAAGDTTEIRIYKKILTGSTLLQIDLYTFTNAQTNAIFYIPHVSSPFGWKLTLKQTAGINRTYEWSVETP